MDCNTGGDMEAHTKRYTSSNAEVSAAKRLKTTSQQCANNLLNGQDVLQTEEAKSNDATIRTEVPSVQVGHIDEANEVDMISQIHAAATLSDIETERDVTPVAVYDVCFGLLCIKALPSSEMRVPRRCTPASLEFENSVIRIMIADTNQRVAVAICKTLWRLVKELAVTLTATICGKKPQTITEREPGEQDGVALSTPYCSLRVVVYGFLHQKDEVADLLAQGEQYLQHPCETEIDREVEYFNPQYLLPPNTPMPPLAELSVFTCCADRTAGLSREPLSSHEKHEIFKIFDTAYDEVRITATVQPSSRLITSLKEHQIVALVMMIEKETGVYDEAQFPTMWTPFKGFDSQTRYQNIVTEKYETCRPPPIGGGILADEMGLGKTLSSLSLICHSLDFMVKTPGLPQDLPRSTLIVAPKSTIYGWEKQIKTHIYASKISWFTYHGAKRQVTEQYLSTCDIVLTTYDTLRSDRQRSGLLYKQAWARVILDEAHKIRNRNSKVFSAVCAIRARNRWCLSGTPIQNCLDDFGALLTFIRVDPFLSKNSFAQYITEPLKKERSVGLDMLRSVIKATCLRRTKAEHGLTLNLPQKTERIEHVQLSQHDKQLYAFFKRYAYLVAGRTKAKRKSPGTTILVLISMLRLICDHGEAMLPESALQAWRNKDENALNWEILSPSIEHCVRCNSEIDELDISESGTEVLECGHVTCGTCLTKALNSQQPCPICARVAPTSPSPSVIASPRSPQANITGLILSSINPSAKIEALLRNITKRAAKSLTTRQPLKDVIFSNWTKMLDLIGATLLGKGLQFVRIDGQLSLSQRKNALDRFESDLCCNIMLASIGAAGEGIDLTSANTVHIIEPHWNPMAEAQAIDRVHRIGQQKDVEVIRYIVDESIETYIQWIQREKIRLIGDSFSSSGQSLDDIVENRWMKLLECLE